MVSSLFFISFHLAFCLNVNNDLMITKFDFILIKDIYSLFHITW